MCLVFTVTPKVQAAVDPACDKSSAFLGMPVWYKYLDVGPEDKDPCAITGPKNAEGGLDIQKAIPRVGLAVVEILLRIAGMVAVAFVIYGGFKYVTSQGEPEAYKTAQRTIINALIGVAISVLAVTIVSVIGGAIL
ncbi:MAG: pilin [Candidatus Saccharibacteria bacterium]|nr:pilin [Candidatus Saccharibacteria bacterium]